MKTTTLTFLALLLLLCTCVRAQEEMPKIIDNSLVEEFSMESPALTKFWGTSTTVKAAILLPPGYVDNPGKTYPVRYNIAGYGGSYLRVNYLMKNPNFAKWWSSAESPAIITVFLDGGSGPYGDPYQLNSDNSGPYGDVLINEIIPAIDAKYRTRGAENRYTDGCSTGGWVSLALQMIYPDSFAGCYSYSPDPVSFHKMQLVDVYGDSSAFTNKFGYLRPSKRTRDGEPEFSIKKEVMDENKDGKSGTYVDSKGQWGSWNALYSPKGENGLPKPVFDPLTGKIDHAVAEEWKKYDLLIMAKENWTELGPKIQGKIYIWMGDMDNYYLNNSMRDFDAYLKQTTSPKSDAVIDFEATKGHCDEYSHRKVLLAIGLR